MAMGAAKSSAMSSPVNTATTSSRAAAAEVSIEVIRACASGERTMAAHRVPGTVMSSR